MEVAGNRSEVIARQPKQNVSRFDLAKLHVGAAWPAGRDSANDVTLPLNRFWLLVPNGLNIGLAKFTQGQVAFGAVDLTLLFSQIREIAASKRWIGSSEALPDFLAGRFDARIVNAVR